MIGDESEGVHNVLGYSISKSDTDLRRTLYQNIVLSGGSTLFKGRFAVLIMCSLWVKICHSNYVNQDKYFSEFFMVIGGEAISSCLFNLSKLC